MRTFAKLPSVEIDLAGCLNYAQPTVYTYEIELSAEVSRIIILDITVASS
jgi:hypothetical protein